MHQNLLPNNNDAQSTTKYGFLLRPGAQIVALRAHCTRTALKAPPYGSALYGYSARPFSAYLSAPSFPPTPVCGGRYGPEWAQKGLTEWLLKWERLGWRNSLGLVLHADLWREVLSLMRLHQGTLKVLWVLSQQLFRALASCRMCHSMEFRLIVRLPLSQWHKTRKIVGMPLAPMSL